MAVFKFLRQLETFSYIRLAETCLYHKQIGLSVSMNEACKGTGCLVASHCSQSFPSVGFHCQIVITHAASDLDAYDDIAWKIQIKWYTYYNIALLQAAVWWGFTSPWNDLFPQSVWPSWRSNAAEEMNPVYCLVKRISPLFEHGFNSIARCEHKNHWLAQTNTKRLSKVAVPSKGLGGHVFFLPRTRISSASLNHEHVHALWRKIMKKWCQENLCFWQRLLW